MESLLIEFDRQSNFVFGDGPFIGRTWGSLTESELKRLSRSHKASLEEKTFAKGKLALCTLTPNLPADLPKDRAPAAEACQIVQWTPPPSGRPASLTQPQPALTITEKLYNIYTRSTSFTRNITVMLLCIVVAFPSVAGLLGNLAAKCAALLCARILLAGKLFLQAFYAGIGDAATEALHSTGHQIWNSIIGQDWAFNDLARQHDIVSTCALAFMGWFVTRGNRG